MAETARTSEEFLDSEGTRIQCGKHGALFDLGSGECVDGPCVGAHLTRIEAMIDEDEICIAGITLEEDDEYDQLGIEVQPGMIVSWI